MAKVKIGDEIIMNKNADKKYKYTTSGYRGIVTDLLDDREGCIEINNVWVIDEIDCDLYGELIENKSASKKIDDTVNHPSHYTNGEIEVITYIDDKNFNYCRGNAIKYISRAGKKNPEKEIEDLKKAEWYIHHEIERLEKIKAQKI